MKKNLVMFTSVFASLAILSTGFAAWVISGGETNDKTTFGDVVIETVTDNRHKMTITQADGEIAHTGKIVFGRPETQDNASAWLKSDASDSVEKLSTFFKVTVTNAATANVDDIFTAHKLEETTGAYTTAAEAGYVGKLPSVEFVATVSDTVTATKTFTADSTTATSGVVYIRLKFSWGAHFGNTNPYIYYNAKGIDEKVVGDTTAGDDAVTSLTEVAKLKDAQFKLTLTTK